VNNFTFGEIYPSGVRENASPGKGEGASREDEHLSLSEDPLHHTKRKRVLRGVGRGVIKGEKKGRI